MTRLVLLLLVLLLVLHQDFWWWEDVEPLLFGTIPLGMAWHMLLTVLAAVTGYLAVRYCWPSQSGERRSPDDPAG